MTYKIFVFTSSGFSTSEFGQYQDALASYSQAMQWEHCQVALFYGHGELISSYRKISGPDAFTIAIAQKGPES